MITIKMRTALVSLAGAAALCGPAVSVADATPISPAQQSMLIRVGSKDKVPADTAGACAATGSTYVKNGATITITSNTYDGSVSTTTIQTATCDNGSWNFN